MQKMRRLVETETAAVSVIVDDLRDGFALLTIRGASRCSTGLEPDELRELSHLLVEAADLIERGES